MQDICLKADISPGSFYRYFASKDDLIVALVESERAKAFEFFDRLEAADDVLAAMIDLAEQMYWRQPEDGTTRLTAEIAAEAAHNPRIHDVCQRIETECHGRMAAVLRRGQRSGQIDPELDPDSTALLLFAIHDGTALRQVFADTVGGAAARLTARRLVVRFLRPAQLSADDRANEHSVSLLTQTDTP